MLVYGLIGLAKLIGLLSLVPCRVLRLVVSLLRSSTVLLILSQLIGSRVFVLTSLKGLVIDGASVGDGDIYYSKVGVRGYDIMIQVLYGEYGTILRFLVIVIIRYIRYDKYDLCGCILTLGVHGLLGSKVLNGCSRLLVISM